jgi:hypothetical protein
MDFVPWLFFCWVAYVYPIAAWGAGITELTQGPMAVTRGDLVTIQAVAGQASSKIEWWIGGSRVCDKSMCEIDTSDFSPGEYIYTVIVNDAEGVATARVSISATDAPPLYTPKKFGHLSPARASEVAVIKNGEWMLVAHAGIITYQNKNVPQKISHIQTLDKSAENMVYSVSGGSQAIIRRIGENEQWLVSSGSTFKFTSHIFELNSGRAIWRRLHESSPVQKTAIVAGARLASAGGLFLSAEIGVNGEGGPRAVISQFEGEPVDIACGVGASVPMTAGTSRVMDLNAAGKCVKLDATKFGVDDPSALISTWSPWWLKEVSPPFVDRWRVEWDLAFAPKAEADLLLAATAALNGHFCADGLDLLGPPQEGYESSEKKSSLLGNCQFSLGMFKSALGTFSKLESQHGSMASTAFMMAQSYQRLGRHKLALEWFDEAERRGFQDRVELARLAAQSALALDRPRERLRWLDTMTLLEPDEGRSNKYREISEDWREFRPRGARARGRMFMDGQALPVNSKTTTVMPAGARTSRSLVFDVDGDWWWTRKITNESRLRISGSHSLSYPRESSISFASQSIHNVSFAMLVGDQVTEGGSPADRWVFDMAGNLGAGISGGERQRDRFGWMFSTVRPKWINLTFGVMSDKYLDPKPGGADVIDIDLNRYTGEADHSHLDLIFFSGLSASNGFFSWIFRGEFGYVDYRTGILDQFDHTHLKASGNLSWQMSRRSTLDIRPAFVSKQYKEDGGTDQTLTVQTGLRFKMAPLWTASIDASLENRSVSKDEASSWTRHTYGLGLASDL